MSVDEPLQSLFSPRKISPRLVLTRTEDPQKALNAAALQALRVGTSPSYRVHQGRIVWSKQAVQLDGVHSSDVSYLADRAGHGLSSRASRPMSRNHHFSPRRVAADVALEGLVVPASRADAVATADRLRRELEGINPTDADPRRELELWDAAFADVCSQVHVHCSERGSLLDAIRSRYAELLERLLTNRRDEITQLQLKYEDAAAKKSERTALMAKSALLFHRATRQGMAESRTMLDEASLRTTALADIEQVCNVGMMLLCLCALAQIQ